MLNPHLGRFFETDPIGFAGGDPHLYRDVGNNPSTFVDPFGLSQQRPTNPIKPLPPDSKPDEPSHLPPPTSLKESFKFFYDEFVVKIGEKAVNALVDLFIREYVQQDSSEGDPSKPDLAKPEGQIVIEHKDGEDGGPNAILMKFVSPRQLDKMESKIRKYLEKKGLTIKDIRPQVILDYRILTQDCKGKRLARPEVRVNISALWKVSYIENGRTYVVLFRFYNGFVIYYDDYFKDQNWPAKPLQPPKPPRRGSVPRR